jgi:hypothetical protein
VRSGAAIPELRFAVGGVDVVDHAAVPTMAFALDVETDGDVEIRSVVLRADVRIALARRAHDVATRERLAELFGTPEQWRSAPRSLVWTAVTVVVPAFSGRTSVALPVVCTYDFDVTATKYLHAVEDGDIPLEFLFSGTVFYAGDRGLLHTARVPWDRDAVFALPVRVWKDVMQRYFPDSAWLRLRKDAFDRLWAFKSRRALPTWEDALDALLRESKEPSPWTP